MLRYLPCVSYIEIGAETSCSLSSFFFELRFLLQYRLHYPVATYTMRKKGSCDLNAVCDDFTSFFLFYPISPPPLPPSSV